MKFIKIVISLVLCFSQISHGQSLTDYVDLFICTSGDYGQIDPSANVPFGMIKLGPDTYPGNHSGYNYEAKRITGFSHNRIGGTGCSGAGGNLRILPGIGNLKIESAAFRKESEKASPGYYSVLFTNGILAELTATNETGIHKYTFPKSDSAFIVVDLGSSFARLISASGEIKNKHEFTASVSAMNVCDVGRYTSHYYVRCNKELVLEEKADNKLYFRFKTKNREEIIFYVTTSPVSTQYAESEWQNLSKNINFDEVRQKANSDWNKLLSRIIVSGKEEYKTLFYTHLYHIFLNPVKTENHLKEFRATNGQIHKSEGYTHYDAWSLWDNFRNKFSLYSIIIPEISSDIANSLIDLYKYGNPSWAGYNEPVPTVRTEHSVITLLDFYKRGITTFNIDPMYQRLSAEIENIKSPSPDTKLEKCYDFWALAQFAEILGKEDDYKLFMNKALEYKIVWKQKFLEITDKSDIMHGDGLYEGTLWQYRWHAQFDMDGMIGMIGSKEKYSEQLEYFFDNNLYNHGNQPDIHVPFMFNFGSKPWLTQKWVNKILTKEMVQYYGTHTKWEKPYISRIYKAEPKGYIPEMDDDEGTMSGWYVLSSIGMYPVLVGDPVFQLSAPIFDTVKIQLEGGKTFEIISDNLSDDNFYIQSATLNGKPFDQTYLNHNDIIRGGMLKFNLAAVPNEGWGSRK
jgi:putative alpha-1,2-mannosidase